jgi:predicted N-formylglutamate amidohydrolase
LIFTCEHAHYQVPRAALPFFTASAITLKSHRGYDAGALKIAHHLSKEFRAPLIAGQYSRLVVDLNRSADLPEVHSKFLNCPNSVCADLIRAIHVPFRQHTSNVIRRSLSLKRQVLHLSVHSFTPVINGKRRKPCDIGILFDPSRTIEKTFSLELKRTLKRELPSLHCRFNYPYKGTSDGHTTALRQQFSGQVYAGIELEFNQAWIKRNINSGTLKAKLQSISRAIRASL